MKQKIFISIFILAIALWSCNGTRTITGPVTAVNDDTVIVNGSKFKIYDSIPAVGSKVTFIETRKKKKVNAKKIN